MRSLSFTSLPLFVSGFVCSAVLLSGGCSHLFSGKKDKDLPHEKLAETESGKTSLISDYAVIGNNLPVMVRGFGLVVDLPGTGGEDPKSAPYAMVLDRMKRREIPNAREILARPSTAAVEILGYIRPGVREGDRFDVQVMLPRDSNAKSLRGGKLLTAELEEIALDNGTMRRSRTHALAAGPIMVDDPAATETNNPAGLKKGTILGGAVVKDARRLTLNLKPERKSVYAADRIAKAVNQRFYQSGGQKKEIAVAKSESLIMLDIHPAYAQDVPRYIKVIQSLACYETPQQQARRIERLQEELQHAPTAQKAAFQLEAVGKAGIPALRTGLQNADEEVRFYAAVSLAYLEDGTPAKVLAETAAAVPAFRVYCLHALSVMRNDLEAESRLRELLHDPSIETRYGAFRALKARNQFDQTIRGETLGGQFDYHGIDSPATPVVHLTMQKLPEIVLFGSAIRLRQPFTLDAGVFFINGQTPGAVVVNRFVSSGVDEKRTVSDRLDEILRAVVDLGGTYPDVVQMLRQAAAEHVLPCRLAVDCLPEPNRTYRRQGSGDSELAENKEEEKKAKQSFWSKLNPRNLFIPNPGGHSSDFTGDVNSSGRE